MYLDTDANYDYDNMKIQSEVKVDDVMRGNQKQTSRLGYADPVQVEL